MKWNNFNTKGKVAIVLGIILAVAVITYIIGLITGLGITPLRIIFGLIYVLFLPGFILTFIFFPKGKEGIDQIERIALSFALSIAVVPLVIFYLNLIGLRISALNTFFSILGIIVIELIIILFQQRYRTKSNIKNIFL
ncbi:DUF1616 domain-containing protein [Candidatus Pacearchaeota archaeon]|nr:DUF1616 domain-containing protein [Candidatus Pacearchaeota archaeon]